MPAKLMKKHADAPQSPKPTGAAKKKNRPQKRHAATLRRKCVERRKRRTGDGAPKRKPASDPSKRHSDAKTKSRGGKLLNGRGRRPPRKLLRSLRRARSAFLSRRKKSPRQRCGGGPGRRPKSRWRQLVVKRRVVGPEKSQSPAHSPTTKESGCAAWLRSAAPGNASASGCIKASKSRSKSCATSLSLRQ